MRVLTRVLFELLVEYQGYDVTAGLERLAFCRSEITRIHEARASAAMIRSRVRWAESGERSTRYFFQLEARRHRDVLFDYRVLRNDAATP